MLSPSASTPTTLPTMSCSASEDAKLAASISGITWSSCGPCSSSGSSSRWSIISGGLRACSLVVGALRQVNRRFIEADDAPPAIYAMMPERWPECAAFEGALLAGDRVAAASIFARTPDRGHSLVDAELHVIQPTLYGIGQKWQNYEVGVAQEHLATAISQYVMTNGLLKAKLPMPNGRRILLACVEGNSHSVGLQIVADAFQLAGWDVRYLGASVPTSALIQQVGQFKPDLLGLSVSFAQQLHIVKAIMSRLTQTHGTSRPAVIVGGLAINQFNGSANQLGVDDWSPDAGAAVTSAATLGLRAGDG